MASINIQMIALCVSSFFFSLARASFKINAHGCVHGFHIEPREVMFH